MNFTNSDLSKFMDGLDKEVPRTIMPWMTDISEVVQAHINARYKPEANGRYLVANSPYDFQQVVDIMHRNFPDADWIGNVPKGHPGKNVIESHFVLDNTRSREELGVVYGPMEQTIVNFCSQYQEDPKRLATAA